MYHDGAGLYLQVGNGSAKSWVLRFTLNKRTREMGLGSARDVPLAEARRRAAAFRQQRAAGVDPIDTRQAERRASKTAQATAVTFKQAAEAYVTAQEASWKNEKHRQQWRSTLDTYASPTLGNIPVASVDVGLVMKVLEPIWQVKPETASRLRGRIESVLDWATAREYRTGDNPARWRGRLQNLLPPHNKIRTVRHMPALPYSDVAQFVGQLRQREGVAPRALEFVILTACRTSEALNATWGEIDFENKIWTIPAARMKAKKEHRVPLSGDAIAVLEALNSPRIGNDGRVFPGTKKNTALSNMSLLAVLKRMGMTEITTHGFRSTFRDWAAERTSYASHVVEMALAHAIGDKVEAAYRRGDLFEKRSRLMTEWARYCNAKSDQAKVVAIRRRK
ncbi:MAG: tyrosine-type recombinase/integrase [Alphaproteobacteria bacterium]